MRGFVNAFVLAVLCLLASVAAAAGPVPTPDEEECGGYLALVAASAPESPDNCGGYLAACAASGCDCISTGVCSCADCQCGGGNLKATLTSSSDAPPASRQAALDNSTLGDCADGQCGVPTETWVKPGQNGEWEEIERPVRGERGGRLFGGRLRGRLLRGSCGPMGCN